MANPQVENGYTKIANDLFLALVRADVSGPEFMVCLAVISKTYGWNKKKDQISLTQFQKLTLLSRHRIIRAIKSLVSRMILGSVTGDTRTCSTYWIIKDYEKWIAKPSATRSTTPLVPRVALDLVPHVALDLVPRVAPTKDTIQNTIKDNIIYNKDTASPVSSSVTDVFEYFIKTCQKPRMLISKERAAIIAKRLKDGYTVDQLCKAIDNFANDDWPERAKYCDIVYVMGVRKGVDNLDRWLSRENANELLKVW